MKTAIRKFNKLCLTTLVAVYFLILVGGVVRSTGSGMGCPDWPKCFGQWIPPTSVEQLPADYKIDYAAYRERKNIKFASLLSKLGFESTSQMLLRDDSVRVESDFNPTKTWIEYLNRLVGVLIGFLIILVFWRSLALKKESPQLFWISLVTLLGVVFQGWFGSIVVSTNLTYWTVTVHMFLALLIVFLLVFLFWKSRYEASVQIYWNLTNLLLLVCLASILVQIFLGTQVREAIDRVSLVLVRVDWISNLGADFILHRSFSWAVLVLHLALIFRLKKTKLSNSLSNALLTLILCGILTGIVMAYFAVPKFIQPAHLLIATVLFGIEVFLFLKLNTSDSNLLRIDNEK